MNKAKPLEWYEPTDHPQDHDGAICVAHGIGGRYSIDPQTNGSVLLWLADDEFVFEGFPTVEAAKARAEDDWQKRYADLGATP